MRKVGLVGLWCLCGSVACGPAGEMVGDTEGDTETGSGSGTASDGADGADDAPPPTTLPSGDGTDTNPPDDTGNVTTTDPGDTGDCPPGTEGCPCDVGASCDGDLTCDEGGVCVGVADCTEIDPRPHADEASAIELDGIACDESNDLAALGTIAGPQEDWYTFAGSEGFGFCSPNPGAIATADVPLSVCIFIECVDGTTGGVSCADGDPADSPDGRPGCCGLGVATLADYACMGILVGDDVDAWVSVSSEMPICVDYDLSYSM